MKSFLIRFLLWGLFDLALAISSWIIFVALIVGPGNRSNGWQYGWLVVCCLLLAVIIARGVRTARSAYTNKEVAVGWRIPVFILHIIPLAAGAYFTCFLIILLLGAGVSVGEPMG